MEHICGAVLYSTGSGLLGLVRGPDFRQRLGSHGSRLYQGRRNCCGRSEGSVQNFGTVSVAGRGSRFDTGS